MHPSMMLDEISTSKLLNEILNRRELAEEGLCTYCKRSINSTPSCKVYTRHSGQDHDDLAEVII